MENLYGARKIGDRYRNRNRSEERSIKPSGSVETVNARQKRDHDDETIY